MKPKLNRHELWIDSMILHKTLSAVRIEPYYNKNIEYIPECPYNDTHSHTHITLQLNGRCFRRRLSDSVSFWKSCLFLLL